MRCVRDRFGIRVLRGGSSCGVQVEPNSLRLSLRPDEILVVDDMRLGMDMARARQVDFAWAAWSDTAPVLKSEMETDADYTFASPGELLDFISKE